MLIFAGIQALDALLGTVEKVVGLWTEKKGLPKDRAELNQLIRKALLDNGVEEKDVDKYGEDIAEEMAQDRGAISDTFVEYLLRWPMIPVAFSFMLFHFSWSVVVFVSASLISAICCYLNNHFYQDNRNEELLDFLEEYDNYEFDKVDLREVVEQCGGFCIRTP